MSKQEILENEQLENVVGGLKILVEKRPMGPGFQTTPEGGGNSQFLGQPGASHPHFIPTQANETK